MLTKDLLTEIAALSLFLAGCTINSQVRVEGWPQLKVIEHYVSSVEMLDQCQKYAMVGGVAEACAEFDLSASECHLYFSKEFPPSKGLIAHEREHCAGLDHIGGTELKTVLDEWRAR